MSTRKYAEDTQVSADRSEAEIRSTLRRYGAEQFLSGWNGDVAFIAFRLQSRFVRFELRMPDRQHRDFTLTPTGRTRTPQAAAEAWEQECRRRWRALALVIKAKLEAVDTGIVSFEREFLAHIILPNQQTVGEWMEPQLQQAYTDGEMPALLPGMREALPALGSGE